MKSCIENLSELLLEVRNNPELHSAALRECESLYRELFVAHRTIKTGAELIQLNADVDLDEIKDDLCRQLFEHELNQVNAINLAKMRLETGIEVDEQPEEIEWDGECNDWDPNDESQYSHAFHYDEDAYIEFDDEEYLKNKSRLLSKIESTKFAVLVNYKGEMEGECVIDEFSSFRTFYDKYDYS